MKKFKKALAAISAAVTLCTISVCSVNVSASDYSSFYENQGIYYTLEEIEALKTTYYLYLDLDESIVDKKFSEDGELTYVIDPDSEVFSYLRDEFGIKSNECQPLYLEYDYEFNGYKFGIMLPERKEEGFDSLSDEELKSKGIKRFVGFVDNFGKYNDKLSVHGDLYDSSKVHLYTLCKNEIEYLPGVKEALGTSFMLTSSLGEPVDVTPLSGDLSMDGKVNIVDAVKLAKYNADPTAFPLLTYSKLAADINGDGELTNADLVSLIQMI